MDFGCLGEGEAGGWRWKPAVWGMEDCWLLEVEAGCLGEGRGQAAGIEAGEGRGLTARIEEREGRKYPMSRQLGFPRSRHHR